MTLSPSIALPISENSQIGEARRLFTRLAADSGLSPDDCARVGLIVTELGTNLVKHAKNGELLARSLANEGGTGILIHSIDQGPGMRNLDQCMADGFSTAGSSGIGLGSLKRKADTFDIYSLEQVGTVIAVSVVASATPDLGLEFGIITAPVQGEVACGDACVALRHGHSLVLAMIDGLGHGPNAADASDEAVRVVIAQAAQSPASLMLFIHDALRKTRGAAVTLARVDLHTRQLSYCSVGNIATSLVRYGYFKTLPSSNGIVGHILPRLENVVLPWTGQDLIVIHSDGLHTHSKVFNQPGLLVRPAPIIAGMVYSQQKRGRDDASVLIARVSEP